MCVHVQSKHRDKMIVWKIAFAIDSVSFFLRVPFSELGRKIPFWVFIFRTVFFDQVFFYRYRFCFSIPATGLDVMCICSVEKGKPVLRKKVMSVVVICPGSLGTGRRTSSSTSRTTPE